MPYRNQLLRVLTPSAIEALQPRLVRLTMRQRLDDKGSVYFIEAGVASLALNSPGRLWPEVGIIGPEGLIGLHAVYGDSVFPYTASVEETGEAARVDAERLRLLIERDPAARAVMLNFARAFSIQLSSTAVASAAFGLRERLARRLLMVSDRNGARMTVTHADISSALAVRRSGITVALNSFQNDGLVRTTRGSIIVVDRAGLVAAASGAYGVAEGYYARLLDHGPSRGPAA